MKSSRRSVLACALASVVAITIVACGAETKPPATGPTPLEIGSASAAPTAIEPAPAPPASSAPSKPAPSSDDGCPDDCHAPPSSKLAEAIAQRAKDSRRCYNNALAKDPTLKGKITVHLKITSDGHVCSAVPTNTTNLPGMQPVADCVAGVYRTLALPPNPDGCADVLIPIMFVGQSPDAGP